MPDARHILLVTDAWQPQINGVVRTLGHTIEQLEKKNIRVTVVHPGLFKTIPLPSYPEIRIALFPGRKIRGIIETTDANTVHLATEGPLGWAARRYCLKYKIPFTTSYHTQFPEYVNLRTHIPLSIGYAVMRYFHTPAHNTFVATQSMQDILASRGFKHLHRWGRGVDTELFRPVEQAKQMSDSRPPLAVYLGRVAIEKNIRAFLDLSLDIRKMVIGGGPDLEILKSEYPDVIFTGFKTGRDLADHIAACDVMVFPSKTDTFGVVMLESMACDVPVAAYPVTGPIDVIKKGQNGWVDDDLAVATRQALKTKPGLSRKFSEQYSWAKSAEQYLSGLAPFHRETTDIPVAVDSVETRPPFWLR